MVFSRRPPLITQRQPVIGFFASMNDKPAALTADKGFISFRSNKQIVMHLDQYFPLMRLGLHCLAMRLSPFVAPVRRDQMS